MIGCKKNTILVKEVEISDLENMSVLEEYRRCGVGSMLYNAFVIRCKSNVVKKLSVQSTAVNVNSINFYRSQGFLDYTLILEADI